MKKILMNIIFSFLCLTCLAQSSTEDNESLATIMRSNGKIYVVVAVMLTILAGLILYLVSIDRKISKLENED
jgi:predicted RNA-binding protein